MNAMVATVRTQLLLNPWDETHSTKFKKILVSGCSFTWNNSEKHICTWPYFAASLMQIDTANVYDCSQGASGTAHSLWSIINEIETNPEVSVDDTLVMVMWSGLTTTDVIGNADDSDQWHLERQAYHYNKDYGSIALHNNRFATDAIRSHANLSKLNLAYKRAVGEDAQVYQSCLNIIALDNYLSNKGYKNCMLTWHDPQYALELVDSALAEKVSNLIVNNIESLGSWARRNNMLAEDQLHPGVQAHKEWTSQVLMPLLYEKKLIDKL
jgi:hypothetical protein